MKRPDARILAKIAQTDRELANYAASLPLVIPPIEWVNSWRRSLEDDYHVEFTTQQLYAIAPFGEYAYLTKFDNEYGRQEVLAIQDGIDYGLKVIMLHGNSLTDIVATNRKYSDFILYEIMHFFMMSEESKYPVEVREKNFRPNPNKKMQWKKPSGPRVLYLNSLPSQHKESKGGTHASPKGHIRRAHTRTLKAERYKNNPLYGVKDGIKIKPVWVGPETGEYEGNIYTVKLQSTAKRRNK